MYDALQYNGTLYLGTDQGVYVRRGESTFELFAGTPKGQVDICRKLMETIFLWSCLGT
jgi:hypothetical protein